MSKAKKQKKGTDVYKIVSIVLGAALAVVIASNIAYFAYLNISHAKAEKELDSAVDSAAAECMELLNSFGMTDTQEEYIAGYTESMKNADTVLKKAYYAETMLTYAASSTNLENSNRLTESYKNGNAIQSKNQPCSGAQGSHIQIYLLRRTINRKEVF